MPKASGTQFLKDMKLFKVFSNYLSFLVTNDKPETSKFYFGSLKIDLILT